MMAYSYDRRLSSNQYAYHGTDAELVPSIEKSGLVPGSPSQFTQKLSKYDDGKHIFFAEKRGYADAYGDILLRFKWPGDARPDMNSRGGPLPGQFVSKRRVRPDQIEQEVPRFSGTWIPLT